METRSDKDYFKDFRENNLASYIKRRKFSPTVFRWEMDTEKNIVCSDCLDWIPAKKRYLFFGGVITGEPGMLGYYSKVQGNLCEKCGELAQEKLSGN